MTEWRPIRGFVDRYEVSDDGQVRSRRRRGTAGGVLSPALDDAGYLHVNLCRPGMQITVRIHTLVLATFIGPAPAGLECRHVNGDPTDNRRTNLAWGTHGENNLDQVRHGTHPHARKTHCPQGHPYDETNTLHHPRADRRCAQCTRDANRERWRRNHGYYDRH